MPKKDNFYVTTPIYYVNWVPHIGHFYSSLIADTITRYNKIRGKETRFTTGVDENSQKSLQEAENQWMDIMKYLDEMAEAHQSVWNELGIDYTDFIRTTEPRHHEFVREVLQKTYDNGDIYEGEYEWMYCIGCEAFKKDDDLIEKEGKKVCPDHLKEPDVIKEKNYFFKLSKYWDKLLEFYERNPDFVVPNDRFNEVKAFVKRGLEDFSISRETNKFWVKLPFDETQVSYVWYDALYNYITSCKYSRGWDKDNADFIDESDFWPASLHVVGKDIIRFHAIFWPAMLMSIWYEPPKQILTTGFFTVDGHKMSKSLGNVIDPVVYSKEFSQEALSLYLLSSFNIWQDGDFDQKQALLTYNAKLANNLWNLVNRVVVLTLKLEWSLDSKIDPVIMKDLDALKENFDVNFKNFSLKDSLDDAFHFLDIVNKYVDENEPWKMIKDETKIEETKEVLYTVAESLRQVWLCLYTFFPQKISELFEKIGLDNYKVELEEWKLEELRNKKEVFKITEKWENLFDRFEV